MSGFCPDYQIFALKSAKTFPHSIYYRYVVGYVHVCVFSWVILQHFRYFRFVVHVCDGDICFLSRLDGEAPKRRTEN